MPSPDEFYRLDYYAELEAPLPRRDRLCDGVLLVRHKHRYDTSGLCIDCPKRRPLNHQPTPVQDKKEK